MSNSTYINEHGDTVFTSAYLRNKGTCCRTTCLHCPYGHTLKTCGLTLRTISPDQLEMAQRIMGKGPDEGFDVTASLLGSAFGGNKKKDRPLSIATLGEYRFVYLKDTLCGLAKVGSYQVMDLYLKEHFKDQGITKDIVTAYLN